MKKFTPNGKYRKAKGSLTAPESSGLRFIINPIDLSAKVEGDTNILLSKKWKKTKEEAKSWFANQQNFKLGEIQPVAVQSDVWVINTLILNDSGVDDQALDKALKKMAALATYEKASVHILDTLFNIKDFDKLANQYFIDNGINVYIYSDESSK